DGGLLETDPFRELNFFVLCDEADFPQWVEPKPDPEPATSVTLPFEKKIVYEYKATLPGYVGDGNIIANFIGEDNAGNDFYALVDPLFMVVEAPQVVRVEIRDDPDIAPEYLKGLRELVYRRQDNHPDESSWTGSDDRDYQNFNPLSPVDTQRVKPVTTEELKVIFQSNRGLVFEPGKYPLVQLQILTLHEDGSVTSSNVGDPITDITTKGDEFDPRPPNEQTGFTPTFTYNFTVPMSLMDELAILRDGLPDKSCPARLEFKSYVANDSRSGPIPESHIGVGEASFYIDLDAPDFTRFSSYVAGEEVAGRMLKTTDYRSNKSKRILVDYEIEVAATNPDLTPMFVQGDFQFSTPDGEKGLAAPRHHPLKISRWPVFDDYGIANFEEFTGVRIKDRARVRVPADTQEPGKYVFSYSVSLPDTLADGQYTVDIEYTDNAGNKTTNNEKEIFYISEEPRFVAFEIQNSLGEPVYSTIRDHNDDGISSWQIGSTVYTNFDSDPSNPAKDQSFKAVGNEDLRLVVVRSNRQLKTIGGGDPAVYANVYFQPGGRQADLGDLQLKCATYSLYPWYDDIMQYVWNPAGPAPENPIHFDADEFKPMYNYARLLNTKDHPNMASGGATVEVSGYVEFDDLPGTASGNIFFDTTPPAITSVTLSRRNAQGNWAAVSIGSDIEKKTRMSDHLCEVIPLKLDVTVTGANPSKTPLEDNPLRELSYNILGGTIKVVTDFGQPDVQYSWGGVNYTLKYTFYVDLPEYVNDGYVTARFEAQDSAGNGPSSREYDPLLRIIEKPEFVEVILKDTDSVAVFRKPGGEWKQTGAHGDVAYDNYRDGLAVSGQTVRPIGEEDVLVSAASPDVLKVFLQTNCPIKPKSQNANTTEGLFAFSFLDGGYDDDLSLKKDHSAQGPFGAFSDGTPGEDPDT
ncbi:MAG: hypothetical protein QGH40_00290, partial [bacterium]|nr:hypothetical protein [bacterium]